MRLGWRLSCLWSTAAAFRMTFTRWMTSTLTQNITETQTVTELLTACTATLTVTINDHQPEMAPEPIEIEFEPILTYAQFSRAVSFYDLTAAGGFPPAPSHACYHGYLQHVGSTRMDLVEQAMLIANLMWESTGFQHKEEMACKGVHEVTPACPYGIYHGRGYMQLSWDYNYRAASRAIFGDDRLLHVPDLVTLDDVAWQTALWYWNTHVHPRLIEHDAIAKRHLGHAVRAINGAHECTLAPAAFKNLRKHPDRVFQTALNRLEIFNALLKDWKLALTSDQLGTLDGCLMSEPEPEIRDKIDYISGLQKAMRF